MRNPVKNSLWVEKYRPTKIEDVIIPNRMKETFKRLIERKEVPILLFHGSPGNGKTTLARVFAEEIGASYIFINASDERGIGTIKDRVAGFAATQSIIKNVKKIVILDEMDNMTPDAMLMLRGFIEKYSVNCRFIFTANYRNKFPHAILSRSQEYEFLWNKEENKDLKKQLFKRILFILKNENIEIDKSGKKALVELIKKYFPDMRKILNEISKYADLNEKIDEGLLFTIDETKYDDLIQQVKNKHFSNVRKFVQELSKGNNATIYRLFFDNLESIFVDSTIPEAVLILSEYAKWDNMVVDKELHLMGCLTSLMGSCSFRR